MTVVALTVDPAKLAAYGEDTYFLESVGRIDALTEDPAGFCCDHAVLLLKPDAVASRGLLPTIDWLSTNGFRIVAAEPARLSRHMVRALWYFQWNQATVYRRWLADLFTGTTDSLVLVVRSERDRAVPASVALTERKGPADPAARVPGQLRHLLGRYSYLLNLVHTADEPADVVRELGVYFDDAALTGVYRCALAGVERSDRARALAERLHEQVPALDLSFGPAADRLAQAVDRLLADPGLDPLSRPDLLAARAETNGLTSADGSAGYRRLVEALWRHRLVPDRWDVVIVGSYVLPMKESGPGPVLSSTTEQDWLARQALGRESMSIR